MQAADQKELRASAVSDHAAREPAIRVESVSRRFGSTQALRDVSLVVARGEIHALLGPNGAGKTTLLRILTGMVEPDDGDVEILGIPREQIDSRAYRKLVGLVPSGDRTFYLRISGLENLMFFARLHGLNRRQAASRGLECLAAVGLQEVGRTPVGLYSHGMQKRLSVARAMLANPSVLFVDEATHDLDPEGARRVRELIQLSTQGGTAVIWATQRLEETWDFVDSVTLLDGGEVRFAGTVSEMVQRARLSDYILRLRDIEGRTDGVLHGARSSLGEAAALSQTERSSDEFRLQLREGAVLGDALLLLARAGISVRDCRQEHSQIEEAFLRLTGEETT